MMMESASVRAACSLLRLAASLLTVMAVEGVAAQVDDYRVDYVKRHCFYRSGDEFSIINVDVEWPRQLGRAPVAELKRHITEKLFEVGSEDFDVALGGYLSRFGQPVDGQLEQLPDHDKYCHADLGLRLMGYEKDRYIAFQLTVSCRPEARSSQKARHVSHLFTYDLRRGVLLGKGDILQERRTREPYNRDVLLAQIASGAVIDEEPDSVDVDGWPLDVCYADSFLVFDLGLREHDNLHNSVSMVRMEHFSFFVTSKMRKWQKALARNERIAEKEPPQPSVERDDARLFAATMPKFNGGEKALFAAISRSLKYPEQDFFQHREGKVVLSYVVEADGSVGDVAVIHPVSPRMDREAVRALRMVCCWTPAMEDGRPVAVRQVIPVVFKLIGVGSVSVPRGSGRSRESRCG